MAASDYKILDEEQRNLAESLFELYYLDFLKISESILHSINDAEEAVAHGFFNIVIHIEKIQQLSEREVFPYCIKIMKNTSIDILRKKHLAVCFDDRTPKNAPDLSEIRIKQTLTLKEIFEEAICSFEFLSDCEKDILRYRFVENMSYGDIAKILNTNEPTLRKRIERIRRKTRITAANKKDGYLD